jgi:orotate phosphoribosyltransferase
VGVAVIVDRGSGAEKAVRATGLSYRSAFSLTDLNL